MRIFTKRRKRYCTFQGFMVSCFYINIARDFLREFAAQTALERKKAAGKRRKKAV